MGGICESFGIYWGRDMQRNDLKPGMESGRRLSGPLKRALEAAETVM